MRRRWRLLRAVAVTGVLLVAVPVGYIEGTCRGPAENVAAGDDYSPLLAPAARRPEARTFLTYPEWHIVYEAEAFARHLSTGGRPSGFDYGRQVTSFWSSYCAVNRVTAGSDAAGEAKVMIYTIGISYTVELAVKAVYENTVGRLLEWIGGWDSAQDRLAADVQRRYGRFMHETPWYRFPFGEAFRAVWSTERGDGSVARDWERSMALSAEYGVKAVYAALIDSASGATLGRDETTLTFVARASPDELTTIDPRLVPVGRAGNRQTIVRAPRYEQFNQLLAKLAARGVNLVEIAGNDDILVTLLLPDRLPMERAVFTMPLERPGWQRVGVAVKVSDLTDTLTRVAASGGTVEHVYDY